MIWLVVIWAALLGLWGASKPELGLWGASKPEISAETLPRLARELQAPGFGVVGHPFDWAKD